MKKCIKKWFFETFSHPLALFLSIEDALGRTENKSPTPFSWIWFAKKMPINRTLTAITSSLSFDIILNMEKKKNWEIVSTAAGGTSVENHLRAFFLIEWMRIFLYIFGLFLLCVFSHINYIYNIYMIWCDVCAV